MTAIVTPGSNPRCPSQPRIWALVRSRRFSARRASSKARSSGGLPDASGSLLELFGGVGIVLLSRHRGRAREALDSECLVELRLDLGGGLGVLGQELLGVVAPLTETQLAVGEERARLLDDVVLEPEVEQAALVGDADAILDVELGLLEG